MGAPILARSGKGLEDAPPPETQLVKDFYRAAELQEDELAGLPYSLLSAATHGRFRQAGLVSYASAGPSVRGVSTAAMHVTLGGTAQTTMYAAVAMRTYLTRSPGVRIRAPSTGPFFGRPAAEHRPPDRWIWWVTSSGSEG